VGTFGTGFSIILTYFLTHYCTFSKMALDWGLSHATSSTKSEVTVFLETMASLTKHLLKD